MGGQRARLEKVPTDAFLRSMFDPRAEGTSVWIGSTSQVRKHTLKCTNFGTQAEKKGSKIQQQQKSL